MTREYNVKTKSASCKSSYSWHEYCGERGTKIDGSLVYQWVSLIIGTGVGISVVISGTFTFEFAERTGSITVTCPNINGTGSKYTFSFNSISNTYECGTEFPVN